MEPGTAGTWREVSFQEILYMKLHERVLLRAFCSFVRACGQIAKRY